MVKVVFHNLASSAFVENKVIERLEHVLDKFPAMERARVTAIVGMENSRLHAGPELFSVKVHISGLGMKPLVLQKSALNVYEALAEVSHRLLELLHRFEERRRSLSRGKRKKSKERERWNENFSTKQKFVDFSA